jgi:hypothetical protein
MTYYQNLINRMEKCMRLHPNSAITMDADTFKVVATGEDTKTLARRMKKAKPVTGIPVLFRRTKAKGAYAWSHLDGDKDQQTRYVAVLEIPPVESPQTAVRASIIADAKASKAQK